MSAATAFAAARDHRPDKDTRIAARVPSATAAALRRAAVRNHRTLGGELRAAIAEHLRREAETLTR
jgi:hypothetical protein